MGRDESFIRQETRITFIVFSKRLAIVAKGLSFSIAKEIRKGITLGIDENPVIEEKETAAVGTRC